MAGAPPQRLGTELEMGVLIAGEDPDLRTVLFNHLSPAAICGGGDPAGLEERLERAAQTLTSLDGLVVLTPQLAAGPLLQLPTGSLTALISASAGYGHACARWFAQRQSSSGSSIVVLLEEPDPASSMSGAQAVAAATLLATVAALARELGSRAIRVNAVVLSTADQQLRSPLNRPVAPEEIAAAVSHLFSAEASYMTGAILRLDGGASAGVARYP